MDFRGDPSAALLEVLDPEQNHSFTDHYLDVEFDLSSVFFIATANVLHTIPQALQDRMEVLRLPGYTEREKVEIAKRHLIPKQIKSHGLEAKNIAFTDEALQEVDPPLHPRGRRAQHGARDLLDLPQGGAQGRARGQGLPRRRSPPRTCTTYLGIPRYRKSRQEERNEIGMATGLAWTEVGGEILPIEVTLMPGKGALRLTGKLGDVMQESAHAAMSYVRSRAEELGHRARTSTARSTSTSTCRKAPSPRTAPRPASPWPRPSSPPSPRWPVRRDVAMTGEITLRGKVLPIGGVKEKLLAAHRIGITTIILPAREREGPGRHPEERARRDDGGAGRARRRGAEDRPGAARRSGPAGDGGARPSRRLGRRDRTA